MSGRKHVAHYCRGSIECIDYIADQGWMVGFCLGNIVKYATRFDHKGEERQDLDKIVAYAEMLREWWDREGVVGPGGGKMHAGGVSGAHEREDQRREAGAGHQQGRSLCAGLEQTARWAASEDEHVSGMHDSGGGRVAKG